jgi:hypothetical protein
MDRLKSTFAFQKGVDPLRSFYVDTKIEIRTERFGELMDPNRSNQYRIDVSGTMERDGGSGRIKNSKSTTSEESDYLPIHAKFAGSVDEKFA